MEIPLTLFITAVFGIYLWAFGQAMYRAAEWPDLVATIVLSTIAYGYAMVCVWAVTGFFPTQAFADLIMPLIELVYGRWL